MLEITGEYQQAMRSIDTGNPITFVTGQAGTGKSVFIDVLRNRYDYHIPVLAPTGVAALNVGGQTINSFFRLPPRIIDPEEIQPSNNQETIDRVKILIIDEISMVRVDTFDIIDRCLRVNRENDTPFGGVKMVVIGDLFQLPPIVTTIDEIKYLADRYRNPFFFAANVIQETGLPTIELTKVFRQKDADFIHLLSNIREGLDLDLTIAKLNDRVSPMQDDYITVTPDNATADTINEYRLGLLPGKAVEFQGILDGQYERSRLPAPERLRLKIGARVMFLKNDTKHRWVNGSLGTVTDLMENAIIKVLIDEGPEVYVNRDIWETFKYRYNTLEKHMERTVIGSYRQFPIAPAWAITIHKSQGKSFDRVNIDLTSNVFEEGQLYVALSRCRSMAGICLSQKIQERDIMVSEIVRKFYRIIVRPSTAIAS